MGIWKREPQVAPEVIAAIQARIDADPVVQRMRNGEGWEMSRRGPVADPHQLAKYIEQRYPMPDGYNVSMQGQVVYGNETGWLRKVVTAAAPVAGVAAAGALLGPAAAAPGLGATGGGIVTGTGLPAATGGSALGTAGGASAFGATVAPGTFAPATGIGSGAAAGSGTALAGGGSTAAASGGVASGLKGAIGRALTTGEGIGDLIRLAPALIGMAGGNDGYGDPRQDPNIQAGLAKQKQRMDATDPAFDTLVNMAYGMSPTAYRPATAPAGYTQPTPSQGAYAAPMPRFGGG